MALFVAVALLIVVGGRKFTPHAPKPGEHRILRALLSENAFRAVREGTRQWLIECPCGHKDDFWQRGGVRFKAVGEPRHWTGCPDCKQATWHRVRRKTEEARRRDHLGQRAALHLLAGPGTGEVHGVPRRVQARGLRRSRGSLPRVPRTWWEA